MLCACARIRMSFSCISICKTVGSQLRAQAPGNSGRLCFFGSAGRD